jgi:DNA-3-methyladenine glycosylase II
MKKSNFTIEMQRGIEHLSKNDPVLRNIIQRSKPCSLKPHRSYYLSLLESIIGQQLSMKAAESIYRRFIQLVGDPPLPEKIILLDDDHLRTAGLSYSKIKYVKDLSVKISNKELKLKQISVLCDKDIIAELTKVKGVGLWTAQMFLIFTLARLDVLPCLDLGIRKSIKNLYGLRKLPEQAGVEKIAKKYNWRPYCSIASWYLWRSLDNQIE